MITRIVEVNVNVFRLKKNLILQQKLPELLVTVALASAADAQSAGGFAAYKQLNGKP